jgi:hypothetical protein
VLLRISGAILCQCTHPGGKELALICHELVCSMKGQIRVNALSLHSTHQLVTDESSARCPQLSPLENHRHTFKSWSHALLPLVIHILNLDGCTLSPLHVHILAIVCAKSNSLHISILSRSALQDTSTPTHLFLALGACFACVSHALPGLAHAGMCVP